MATAPKNTKNLDVCRAEMRQDKNNGAAVQPRAILEGEGAKGSIDLAATWADIRPPPNEHKNILMSAGQNIEQTQVLLLVPSFPNCPQFPLIAPSFPSVPYLP